MGPFAFRGTGLFRESVNPRKDTEEEAGKDSRNLGGLAEYGTVGREKSMVFTLSGGTETGAWEGKIRKQIDK